MIVCFASGNGSNFAALMNAGISIDMLITNNPNAYAIQRAHHHDVSVSVSSPESCMEFWKLNSIEPRLILLSGYMRILPPAFVDRFRNRIINIHPSLLPSFKGLNAIEKAYSAGVKYTGVTIHYVDEGIDTGTIIAQTPVYISPTDSLDDLKENIHQKEHWLYPLVVKGLLAETFQS